MTRHKAQKIIYHCRHHGEATHYVYRDGRRRCAPCTVVSVDRRRKKMKLALIEMLGGKCRGCGYATHPLVLQFHHVDPSTKEFIIGRGTIAFERLRAEALKCALVCPTCHFEIEMGLRPSPPAGIVGLS